MPVTYNNKGLLAIRAGLKDAIDQGLGAAAGHIGDLAQQFAPVDTGALKDSKVVERVAPGQWRVSFGRGLPDIRAVAQEYGTISQPAQPYLTPAATQIDVDVEVGKAVAALITRNGI